MSFTVFAYCSTGKVADIKFLLFSWLILDRENIICKNDNYYFMLTNLVLH